MTRVWYCTREQVKTALDVKATARSDAQIDRIIGGVSEDIEAVMHRRFYPWRGTRAFDWPNFQYAPPWKLYLNDDELVSADTITSGGAAITEFDLRRGDAKQEAPYSRVELRTGSNDAFTAGASSQLSIQITGTYAGCPINEFTGALLAETLDTTETEVDIDSGASVGLGSLIRIDSERMIVTGRKYLTTGQTLQTSLTAATASTTVAVTNGTSFFPGEIIAIESEFMLIVEIIGNNLTVRRAWDGSQLAAHTNGVTIYASRTLVCERGVLGTTAAAHNTNAPVKFYIVPPGINSLAVASSVSQLIGEQSGMTRRSGTASRERQQSLPGGDISGLWERAYTTYGRKARKGAA